MMLEFKIFNLLYSYINSLFEVGFPTFNKGDTVIIDFYSKKVYGIIISLNQKNESNINDFDFPSLLFIKSPINKTIYTVKTKNKASVEIYCESSIKNYRMLLTEKN